MNQLQEIIRFIERWIQYPLISTENTVITVWSVIVLLSLMLLLAVTTIKLGQTVKRLLSTKSSLPEKIINLIGKVAQLCLLFFGGAVILDVSDIDVSAAQIFGAVSSFFSMPLVPVGKQPITLSMVLFVLVLGYFLIYFSGKLQRWTARKLRERPSLDYGTAQSVTSIARYLLIGVGFVIILQAAGIDLSTVTVIAGALGLGVGLGLQNIVSNLVSGLVVMFERPVKVGDRIEVGGVHGDVIKLSLRAATIKTNNNIEIIVPNNEFINGNVVNWSHSSKDVRFCIPVGVSYNANPDEVKTCLLKAAERCDSVLKSPRPDVIFDGFGDSALNFELRVYTHSLSTKPKVLRSQLNFLIFEELCKANIEIPFPQRDLHIRSSWLQEAGNNGGSRVEELVTN